MFTKGTNGTHTIGYLREASKSTSPTPGQGRPLHIALEGLNCAGKSTLKQHLFLPLAFATNRGVQLRSDPDSAGGVPDNFAKKFLEIAREKREWHDLNPPQTALLYAANRMSLSKLIRQDLDRGFNVLCDRSLFSTCAYQGQTPGVTPLQLLYLQIGYLQVPLPDLVVHLDLPWEAWEGRTSPERNFNRGGSPLSRKRFEEMREIYRNLSQGLYHNGESIPGGGELYSRRGGDGRAQYWLTLSADQPVSHLVTQVLDVVCQILGLPRKEFWKRAKRAMSKVLCP